MIRAYLGVIAPPNGLNLTSISFSTSPRKRDGN
jgi:hypothetical protein